MCPKIDLFAGDFEDRIVIFFEQQPLEFLASLGVAALADQQGWRVLSHGNCSNRRSQARDGFAWAGGMRPGTQLLDQCFQMVGGGSAASPNDGDVVLLDKFQ